MNVLDVRNILNVTATANNKKATTPDMTSYSTGITVDDELSPTSKNPVQNKVVYAALQEKQDLLPSGNTGDFLQKTADGVQWSPVSGALPTQTGQSGKFLTTDGTDASWATVDALPSQTSQSGKFLTTNGTTASWDNIPTELPSQTGNSGKFLTTDGSSASWATVQAGANTSLSNLADAGKIQAAHLAMPSTVYEDLTIPPSGTVLQAPADGYIIARQQDFHEFSLSTLDRNTDGAEYITGFFWNRYANAFTLPVSKGGYFAVYWFGTPEKLRFVYAKGSESEYTPS